MPAARNSSRVIWPGKRRIATFDNCRPEGVIRGRRTCRGGGWNKSWIAINRDAAADQLWCLARRRRPVFAIRRRILVGDKCLTWL